MIIAGIDEAGRGPAIGPLVIAIVAIDEKDEPRLKELGVKDSKLLSPSARERIFTELKKFCKYEIIPLTPEEIDAAVDSEGLTNLNWLEADTAARLMNHLKPDKTYVDCPSPNMKAYTTYLVGKLDYKPQLVVEHKADYKYLVVGAASILAKVTRDRAIEDLKKKHKIDFGSGYPSDPVTAEFIKENWNKYDFFRKSWGPYKAAAAGKQKKLGEY